MGVASTEPGQSDHLEQLRDPCSAEAPGEPEADVLGHREVREEGVVLEDHPDLAVLGRHPRTPAGDDSFGGLHRARVRSLESGDEPEQRRLPAARRAEEGYDLAPVDAE